MSPKRSVDGQTLTRPTQTRATSKAAVNIVTMFEYIVLLLLQLILVCADALTHSQPASLEPVSVCLSLRQTQQGLLRMRVCILSECIATMMTTATTTTTRRVH